MESIGVARFSFCAAAILLAGCASSGAGRQSHLPFRVAIVPVEVRYVDTPVLEGEMEPGLRIEVDPTGLGDRIARVLATQVFADSVILDPPAEVSDDWGTSGRDEHWIGEAAKARANLLLECSVRVDPIVRTHRNDRFWLNMLLFVIGGPASWFVPDRSYVFEAHLSAQLHQIEPLRSGAATLGDGRARLAFAHARVQEIELDLIDRAGGNMLPYVGSLLIPASFLASESDRAVGTANEMAAALLASELGSMLANLEHQIAYGGPVTDIVLSDDLEVKLTEDRVELRGAALLRRRAANRLDGYKATCAGRTVDGFFGEGIPDAMLGDGRSEYLRYPFEVTLPRIGGERHIELELIGGGRDRPRRTFCIPLSW